MVLRGCNTIHPSGTASKRQLRSVHQQKNSVLIASVRRSSVIVGGSGMT